MANDDIALITTLVQTVAKRGIINFADPHWAMDGDAAVTLEKAVASRSIVLGYDYDIENGVQWQNGILHQDRAASMITAQNSGTSRCPTLGSTAATTTQKSRRQYGFMMRQ